MARVGSILPRLKLGYAGLAFVLVALTYLVLAIRWSLVLRQFHIVQRICDSWHYYMIGGFYSTVLPGSIGGDVIRLGLSAGAHNRSKALLAASILFERTCGLVVTLVLAAVTALLVPMILEHEPALVRVLVAIALCALMLFILFFLMVKTSPLSWFETSGNRQNWRRQTVTLLFHFRNVSLGSLSLFLTFSVWAHLLDILASFFLSQALHIHQPFVVYLLIMPIVYVMTTLPISLGGVGVREGVLTFFLVRVGVPTSDAVLLSLIIYGNRVLVSLIGGILQFINRKSALPQNHENLP